MLQVTRAYHTAIQSNIGIAQTKRWITWCHKTLVPATARLRARSFGQWNSCITPCYHENSCGYLQWNSRSWDRRIGANNNLCNAVERLKIDNRATWCGQSGIVETRLSYYLSRRVWNISKLFPRTFSMLQTDQRSQIWLLFRYNLASSMLALPSIKARSYLAMRYGVTEEYVRCVPLGVRYESWKFYSDFYIIHSEITSWS